MDSDISLKELFLNIQSYLRYILGHWFKILLFALVFALLFTFWYASKPLKYEAELSFMLNEDERSGLSGLTSLLGNIGFGLNSGEANLDKILDLSKARKIAQLALFQEKQIHNNSDFLANHIIDNLASNNKWKSTGRLGKLLNNTDSISLDGFRFSHDNVDSFNRKEHKALKKLHAYLIGGEGQKGVFKTRFNDLSGILTFKLTTYDESLTIQTLEQIFESLSQFYIDKAVEKQKYDYELIKSKYDSVTYLLNNVQIQLANFEDNNKDLYRKKDILRKNQLKIEEQKLILMIGKAEEQLQVAALALENKTPFIQIIDKPIPPIKPSNNSAPINFILAFIIANILAVFYFFCKKTYLDVMS